MRLVVLALAFVAAAGAALADPLIAPTGRLRAAFLQGYSAHGTHDPATGQSQGLAVELANEFGRSIGVPTTMVPLTGVASIIGAVRDGRADIGFVAYDPSRVGTVDFSQTYLLVKQTFLVRKEAPFQSVADLDQAGLKVGAGRGDLVSLFLRRNFEKATLVEASEAGPDIPKQMLATREVDAYGANRQRLTVLAAASPDYRVLRDDLFGVPQAIIVPKAKPTALMTLNKFIDEARTSGLLKSIIERTQVIGVEVAPPTDR